MKNLNTYINEALKLGKSRYKYYPKTKEELKRLINRRIEQEGNKVDLNDIDVSNITDMSTLFGKMKDFNGDISQWDVSNVTDTTYMFYGCKTFNQDISKWIVSNVNNMCGMFYGCAAFNQDISKWDVSNVIYTIGTFSHCQIEEKYKPKFK